VWGKEVSENVNVDWAYVAQPTGASPSMLYFGTGLNWAKGVNAPTTYFAGFDNLGYVQQDGLYFYPNPSTGEDFGTDPVKVTQMVQGFTVGTNDLHGTCPQQTVD
jgi:hypothetical protein